MISLCSVMLDKIQYTYRRTLVQSILDRTKLISEVIFANNSKDPSYYEEWKERDVVFREFGSQENFPWQDGGNQHGLGLNYAIERATQPYVYLCDPDIFFYTAVDEIYLKLIKQYELQAVGASHYSAASLSHTFFPWHGNILMDRNRLPPKDFLHDKLKINGKYLMAGEGQDYKHLYPNPNGNFDTCSALWLWANQDNWKWFSFQTADAHTYTTQYYRGNTKIKERLPREKLFYHAVSGSIVDEPWEPYYNLYKESLKTKKKIDVIKCL